MAARARKLHAVDDKAPVQRRGGRPKSKLTSAITSGTEREVLVILRQKLAAKLDGDVPTHSFDKLLRQFDQYDRRIRAIDAREAESNAADDDDLDDDEGDAGWDSASV